MKTEELEKILRECFKVASKSDKKGMKHKGLLIVKPDLKSAKEYIQKAKLQLELCDLYKQKGIDYKIPEEWFYTLYYCGLAILTRLGVESRSQKYTALLLKYLIARQIVEYNPEFVDRIMVYTSKDEKSEVDEREESRYSPSIKNESVIARYSEMSNLCKKAISQAEEIIYSEKEHSFPKDLTQ